MANDSKTTQKTRPVDPEALAISRVKRLLGKLPADVSKRVAKYIADVYASPANVPV